MTSQYPSAGYTITIRLEYTNNVGMLGKITTGIGESGDDITAVDLVRTSRGKITRDITLNAQNSDHGQEIAKHLRKLSDIRVVAVSDPLFYSI